MGTIIKSFVLRVFFFLGDNLLMVEGEMIRILKVLIKTPGSVC